MEEVEKELRTQWVD